MTILALIGLQSGPRQYERLAYPAENTIVSTRYGLGMVRSPGSHHPPRTFPVLLIPRGIERLVLVGEVQTR